MANAIMDCINNEKFIEIKFLVINIDGTQYFD